MIVRYEDLWTDTKSEIGKILTFLELSNDRYDFDAALNLPIRGSSTVRKNRSSEVHWDPIEKPPTFDPMSRYRHWNVPKHERFNWVAGRQLEGFGYQQMRASKGRAFWCLWNIALDLWWVLARTFGPVYLKWKRSIRR
jgi:hypothetical protein